MTKRVNTKRVLFPITNTNTNTNTKIKTKATTSLMAPRRYSVSSATENNLLFKIKVSALPKPDIQVCDLLEKQAEEQQLSFAFEDMTLGSPKKTP